MFTDSHCHLNFPQLHSRLGEVYQAMAAAQVNQALCICTTLEEFEGVYAIAQNPPAFMRGLYASVGVHPDNAGEGVQEPSVDDLVRRGQRAKVVAVGETGLDYFRSEEKPPYPGLGWQRERFRTHIRAARQLQKPLVIHTRHAAEDTLRLLQEEGEDGSPGSAGGVFHCFTESLAVARAALEAGFYISFSGIVTFKNAQALREVAALVPLDRCLIETDSPYLAPAPFRGKTNDPSLLPWVAKALADVQQLPLEKVAEVTGANFQRLFLKTAP